MGGDTGHITGILAPAAKVVALETAKDLEVIAIDEHTLNEIVLKALVAMKKSIAVYLVLNKSILKSFLKVRGTDKKPVYKVGLFNNQTIDGVPYIISQATFKDPRHSNYRSLHNRVWYFRSL